MPSYEELMSGPPPASASTSSGPRPIGVPEYVRDPASNQPVPFAASRYVPNPDQYGPGVPLRIDQPPTFYDGDEYQPATWSVEDKARLQLAMRNAGLIGPRQSMSLGTWDDTTVASYRKLLEYANSAGHTSPIDALRDYASNKERLAAMGLDIDGTELREPLVIKRTNPADLRRAADAVAPTVLGRKLRPEQLDRLVAAYQQIEEQEQRALYDTDATGGAVTQAPSFETFAADQARRMDPQGAAEMDWVSQSNEFFQLLTDNGLGA